ncbi:hypothetical protein [Desulfohalovibrio reitneri]|uniref:hypothetical protein n=1 Tax=Desulfohalovibrio reitneri TaxID=1307759 RepID=UPI0004A70BE5|nr:hypothetical protein [Desulfohalovibrio reitneri]
MHRLILVLLFAALFLAGPRLFDKDPVISGGGETRVVREVGQAQPASRTDGEVNPAGRGLLLLMCQDIAPNR